MIVNAIKIVPATSCLDFINAHSAASEMSRYEETLFYTDNVKNDLEDVKVYKAEFIALVDNGAAHTSVKDS